VGEEENYFSALGVPHSFRLDGGELQIRFYELSRALHPDRFATQGDPARSASLQRMSFLNEAFRTLRDPAELRTYVLKLNSVGVPEQEAKGTLPADLAELWFELQDLVMEDPITARRKIGEFEVDLAKFAEDEENQIRELEQTWETTPVDQRASEQLQPLAKLLRGQQYLRSLTRDVSRLRDRLGPSAGRG
jgi:molecular chaperone HscB